MSLKLVTQIRAGTPQLKRLSYFLQALPTNSLITPPMSAGRPICFFTGVPLKDHETDIVYLDVSGEPREKMDKRTGLQGGGANKCGGKPADPDAQSAAPIIVWCHAKLADFMMLTMEGRFYKQTSKFEKSPYLVYEQMVNRLRRVLKRCQKLEYKVVLPPNGLVPAHQAQIASIASPTTPPLGTPSTSPSVFAHPVTDTEYTNWVSTLTFNYWNERDLILHFLGTPKNGFVPKSQFVAMMDALFTQAEMSAPSLLAAIKSRFPHKDWGHQGIETGWVDFREI